MIKLGLKSRSRRVVQDSSVVVEKSKNCLGKISRDGDEDCDKCCWERLPSELLREVLMKLEESESNWPARKHVLACAGVCRSWREVMKEVVKTPEVCGKITFPISVKQPGPRESLLRCFIKRNRSTHTFYLYANISQGAACVLNCNCHALADDGKFLLASRKYRRTTCADYMISLNADDTSKGSPYYIGKLRSNLLGRKFVVYDALPPHYGTKMSLTRSATMVCPKQVSPMTVHKGSYPVANISYELNVLGSRGPRRMHCVLDVIPASAIKPGGIAPTQTHFPITSDSSLTIPFFRSRSSFLSKSSSRPLGDQTNRSLVLKNKSPRWHEQLQCWCLNFHGRVTVASVKNFQLVASPENGLAGPEHDRVILQFGKVGKDIFTMDYGYPISAFHAFAICLSSFDTKIACE